MIFDLHLHTRIYSDCSFINPEDLIRRAVEIGLDGIALTEHGMRWPDEKFEDLRRIADPLGLMLINGQEIYTASDESDMEGEFLVFGLKKSVVRVFPARELVERVHGEGGILVAAHPYKLSRNRRFKYYGAGDRISELQVDAIELFHPDHNEQALQKVFRAMRALDLPGTGGSDAHKIFSVGSCVTVFKDEIRTEEDFIRAILNGTIRGEKRTRQSLPE
jgi:predicted metal-dependent phosphoesterase TrpH